MKYQIGIYAAGPEAWNFYRDEQYRRVDFDTLAEAEAKAQELSRQKSGVEVIIVTLHGGFKTEIEYPEVKPIVRTKRLEFGEPAHA